MNVREGMRRLGLVLGVLGAVAGGIFAHTQLQPLLAQRAQYRAFRMLVSSPIVQRVIGSLNELSQLPPVDARGDGKQIDYGDAESIEVRQSGVERIDFGKPHVKTGPSKQQSVYSAADVSAIKTENGQTVYQTEPPAFWPYVLIPVYPILGFFIPWGAMKTLTWVGGGFFHPRDREAAQGKGNRP